MAFNPFESLQNLASDPFGTIGEFFLGGTEVGEFMPTVQQVNPLTAQFQELLSGLTQQQIPTAMQGQINLGQNVQPFLSNLAAFSPDAMQQFSQALPLAQQLGQEAAQLMAPSGQTAADIGTAAGQQQAASLFQGLGGAESGAAKAALAQGALMPQLQFQQAQNQLAQNVQNQALQQLLGQQLGVGQQQLGALSAGGQLGLGLGGQQLAQQQQAQNMLSGLLGMQGMLAAPQFVGSQLTQQPTPGLFDILNPAAELYKVFTQ